MTQLIEEGIQEKQILVIDGSMSTALENLGCDLNDSLWTAKALVQQPELIKQVHHNYFQAGADVGITASYQATIPGLKKKGYSTEEGETIIAKSVALFREAREEWWETTGKFQHRLYPICLAGMGPYGAYLADGSEYKGNYGVADSVLREFHQRRAEILWAAQPDLLLFETQPSLHEALIAADIAEKLGADYWISFSCKDGEHICEGNTIEECAKALSVNHPHLQVIGVNCTAPQYIDSLIKRLKAVTSLPIAVYPNSGEIYDPVTKTWHGAPGSTSFEDNAATWMKSGAQLVGGCCRTVAYHIEAVSRARAKFLKEQGKNTL